MKYKLYIPDLGETIDDAHEIECKFGFEDMVVAEYCEYLWSDRDGWDWMNTGKESTKIHVVDENGNESVYTYDIDFEPVFSVTKTKMNV